MEVASLGDEIAVDTVPRPPARLPPVVGRNSVAPADSEAPVPAIQRKIQWFKKPKYLIIPITSIVATAALIVIVGSALKWGKKDIITTTAPTTYKTPRNSSVLTIIVTPSPTNLINTTNYTDSTNMSSSGSTTPNYNSTGETTTNSVGTVTGETTINSIGPITGETATNSVGTTTGEVTTTSTSVSTGTTSSVPTTINTATTNLETASTSTSSDTGSTSMNTTTTGEVTSTVMNIEVSHSFVLTINERFTAELLDPADFPYHILSRETSANITKLFNNSSGYQGCAIESLQEGSIEVFFSLLFLYPSSANLSQLEEEVIATMASALPDINEDTINLTKSCIDCTDNAYVKDLIDTQSRDYCGEGNNCTTNGTCVNGLDRYFCLCERGHYGEYCELLTSDCDNLLCNNNGQCAANMTGDLFCECMDTHEGDSCTIPVVNATYPCSNFTILCSNHGECIDLSNSEYFCVCEAGYSGTDCEEDIDYCYSSPCFHGNCTDAVNGFVCSCEAGYEGVQCQIDIDECQDLPCGLNATCYDLVNNIVCSCDAGFTGSHCHSICDDSPCFNNGTCTLCPNGYCTDTKLSFKCDCPSDIYGLLCTNEKYPGFNF